MANLKNYLKIKLSLAIYRVRFMKNVVKKGENLFLLRIVDEVARITQNGFSKTPIPCDQTTCTAMAGVLAAQRCIAAAIVVITSTGKTAEVVAKYKPRCPIIAVTRYAPVARRLHLFKAIVPLVFEDLPEGVWSNDLENRISFAVKWAMEKAFIRNGDPVVIICGWRPGTGYTNTMRVIYALD